jgi:hypothetical protein
VTDPVPYFEQRTLDNEMGYFAELLSVQYSPEPAERPLVEGFLAQIYPVW